MEYRDISYINLLKETLKTIIAIYLPLLVIGLPAIILAIIIIFLPESSTIGSWLDRLLIVFVIPWLSAIRYFYIWRYLKRSKVTLMEAFSTGIKKWFPILILPLIVFAPITFMPIELIAIKPFFILLLLPIIYMGTRLGFYWHTIIIDGVSTVNGIKYSWEVTKGYFGFITRLNLILFGVGFLIIFPFTILTSSVIKTEMVNDWQSVLIQYVFAPIYWSIISVLIYAQLKRIKT